MNDISNTTQQTNQNPETPPLAPQPPIMPAQSANITNNPVSTVAAPTPSITKKNITRGWWLVGGGAGLFVILLFLFGVVLGLSALLCGYGATLGFRYKSTALGITGVLLGVVILGIYILAIMGS